MTRTKKTLPPPGRAKKTIRRARGLLPGHWLLQDAKEFRRLKGERSGDALIAAMQASPHRDIDIEPKRDRMPVRGVDL
jgi:hypothetical protein